MLIACKGKWGCPRGMVLIPFRVKNWTSSSTRYSQEVNSLQPLPTGSPMGSRSPHLELGGMPYPMEPFRNVSYIIPSQAANKVKMLFLLATDKIS